MIWLGSKREKQKPDVELPAGSLTVSDTVAETESKQELDGSSELSDKSKNKVWYVLIEISTHGRTILSADGKSLEFIPATFQRTWLFDHTKSWARELARAEQRKGHRVIDIFPGTKAHISHKFGGLK